ncbi:MAG: hypothetical protein IPH31_05360 [Lewinellaceae bacterium]|nr:hypothetical protein [Lewinellaceae bacterium]
MKKIYFLLFCLIEVVSLPAQCPTGDIILSTQLSIDSFSNTYPGCTHMPYSITIAEGIPGNILNVKGLLPLNSIGGNLTIGSTMA